MLSAADRLRDDLGEPEPKPKRESKTAPRSGDDAFKLANAVDTFAVLDRLNIDNDGQKFATCPGCNEPKAKIGNDGGLKCLHNRCSDAGPADYPGFRSNVDLVALVENIEPLEAAKRICEWFGIELPKEKKANGHAHVTEPPEGYDLNAEFIPPKEDGAPPVDSDSGKVASERNLDDQPRWGASPDDVLRTWLADGPLIHEPTGIKALDELTGGGPVYGTRWYLAGAPDAGKTALLLMLAHLYAQRGITVGLLAVDEEPGDMVTRLVQRCGWSRQHCEIRDPGEVSRMGEAVGGLPIRFYDGTWTIEAAAQDLATYALERNDTRTFLGIDSVQTVECDAEIGARAAGREMSEVAAVTARSRAIRAVATRHRLIALATSEMGRGAYRSGDPSQQSSTLSSAKWSGAIEYSARVLIGMRSVAGETDLIDLEMAKNKHGPRSQPGDPATAHVFLRIDRRSQMLSEVSYEPPAEEDRDDQRERKTRDQTIRIAGIAAAEIAKHPGMVRRDLESAVRAAASVGVRRACDGIAALGEALVVADGARRAQHHHLDGSRLPEAILGTLPPDLRDLVSGCRPPEEQAS